MRVRLEEKPTEVDRKRAQRDNPIGLCGLRSERILRAACAQNARSVRSERARRAPARDAHDMFTTLYFEAALRRQSKHTRHGYDICGPVGVVHDHFIERNQRAASTSTHGSDTRSL